ncbi:hypothetical protein [Synoicihabitans lomoniglobus]|uniref:Uncharacterized protein n=1 Tax=Synoicihabitans lomoniglobus TaxID=2909285 RepID=A0AAE9ZVP5_9BACT|nr:hypothetical protein [Opitutaceae bacterium LMO-M01]WED64014.1 hypothetical protein PXH66_16875 [Opitutaceae bacterium LMO-M01]
MDNEFADLEAELRQLRPRQPCSRLQSRIAEVLDAPELAAPFRPRESTSGSSSLPRAVRRVPVYTTATTWTSWKWANWGVAAALVALMTVLSISHFPPAITAADPTAAVALGAAVEAPTLRPVKAGRTIIGSRSDGVIELADGSAVERVRDYFVDTIEWRDPAGVAQLRWEVPRESVRFVGLAAY